MQQPQWSFDECVCVCVCAFACVRACVWWYEVRRRVYSLQAEPLAALPVRRYRHQLLFVGSTKWTRRDQRIWTFSSLNITEWLGLGRKSENDLKGNKINRRWFRCRKDLASSVCSVCRNDNIEIHRRRHNLSLNGKANVHERADER